MTDSGQAGSARAADGRVRLGGRPPFAFRVEVPDDWTVLDTAPATWRRSARDMLGGDEGLSDEQRRAAMAVIADVVETAQTIGTCATAVKLARDADDRVFWGSLSLTWYDSRPIEPDLTFLKIVAGNRGRRETFECDLGEGLMVRGRTVWAQPLPGIMTEGRTYDTQIFLPVPGTTWTALFSGSTAAAAHDELMVKLVRRMALSLDADIPAPRSEPRRDAGTSNEAGALKARLRSAARRTETDPSGPQGR